MPFKSVQENLNSSLRKALISLQKNSNIVFKPADKGGNIVILDKLQYTHMCLKILDNSEWYEPIEPDELERAHSILTDLITEANRLGVIDYNMTEFLSIKFPIVPVFYTLPKILKGIIPPPGRPIVSSFESSTEAASQFFDDYLRTHVHSLPSYLRDMTQLLQIIEGMIVPDEALLVTIDIEALYSSVAHELGIKMVSTFLSERDRAQWPMNSFVLSLLRHILNNIF